MTFQAGHTSPNLGKVITTRPLLWDEIQKVKEVVQNDPRDRALLSLALNTGLRAKALSELRWSNLVQDGDRLTALIRESKTGKLKRLVLNAEVARDLLAWKELSTSEFVISGQRGQLTVGSIGRLVKHWATQAGIDSTRIAAHSLRKARCRALVEHFNEPLWMVMKDLNHSSEAQTAAYIGITTRDQERLYEHVI